MNQSKRILDSVHGYIEVPKLFVDKIIDTIYFQRLRRIEQTSTRALFPSARHDRFIHSLGVYHIGKKIIDSLRKRGFMEKKAPLYDYDQGINSYLIACLLHDIAHSPFSHTFEDFFKQNSEGLDDPLIKLINNDIFTSNYKKYSSRAASHEKMSAYLAYHIFKPKFEGPDDVYGNMTGYADWELIVRMICGIYYSHGDKAQIYNCLIDLIHGDVIDADGLDYVCRDAWAAGYQTSNVDVDRLIDAIEIHQDNDGNWQLAFTSKALNEIEAVLSVKNFQQYHVINHHTVTYEQHLLVEAVKAAAKHHFPPEDGKPESIAQLCNYKSFFSNVTSKTTGFSIIHPMDDDFISLMKSHMEEHYVKEWFERNYRLVPVWKSRADFYEIFPDLRGVALTSRNWIFSGRCKSFLKEHFGLNDDDVWILKASPKYKGSFAKKVYIRVNGNIVKYVDLFPGDKNSFQPSKSEFYYIFVKRGTDLKEVRKQLKNEVELYIEKIVKE